MRRSVPPQFLAAPGPDAAQIDELLTIASRVPDHGKLVPWRFIVFSGEGRLAAADVVAEAFRTRNPDARPEQVEFERNRLLQAPVIVAVVSRAGPHVKIPEWEQVHWESFHSGFVDGVELADWRRMLVLEEEQ